MSDHHDHAANQTAHHHSYSPHAQDQANSFAEANKEHFNANTALSQFDKPQMIEMARRISAAFKKQYDFDEEKTAVLDFACGNGLISRELAGDCKSIVGVDISQTLVDDYNERVSNQGISPDEMRAVCIELKGEASELGGLKFDVVVLLIITSKMWTVLPGYSHSFLKPGGVLLVSDFLDPEEANRGGSSSAANGSLFPDGYQHIVAHLKGFKSENLHKLFEGAGLSFSIDTATHAKLHGENVTMFVARGQKPM